MEKYNVQEILVKYGKKIKEGLKKISKDQKVNIYISGLDSIPRFDFAHKHRLEISTFFTQEMLKAGFLAQQTNATTYSYNDKIINNYLGAADEVFKKINKYVLSKKKFPLKGPIKHSSFKRLT